MRPWQRQSFFNLETTKNFKDDRIMWPSFSNFCLPYFFKFEAKNGRFFSTQRFHEIFFDFFKLFRLLTISIWFSYDIFSRVQRFLYIEKRYRKKSNRKVSNHSTLKHYKKYLLHFFIHSDLQLGAWALVVYELKDLIS